MKPNDGYKIPDETKALLFNMVPTVGFGLATLAILCAPGPATMYERLKDFDGLLAGALAIFAAYITVRQMRRTDSEQARLHNEQMSMASFRERMAVARMQELVAKEIRGYEPYIERLRGRPCSSFPPPVWEAYEDGILYANATVAARRMWQIVTKCDQICSEDLFTPSVARALRECRDAVQQWADVEPNAQVDEFELTQRYRHDRPENFYRIIQAMVWVQLTSRVFADEIDVWAAGFLVSSRQT